MWLIFTHEPNVEAPCDHGNVAMGVSVKTAHMSCSIFASTLDVKTGEPLTASVCQVAPSVPIQRHPCRDPPMWTPVFFLLPNPLHPSSQVYPNSWARAGSHTSLRPVLILRCWSWRLKSMKESDWNLSVRLRGTHTQPEASVTVFTPGLALF